MPNVNAEALVIGLGMQPQTAANPGGLAAALKTTIGLAINETVNEEGLKPGDPKLMDNVADNLQGMPFAVQRPNGNILIQIAGINVQVFTSTKMTQSGQAEKTVQVNITGSSLPRGSNFSNRHGTMNRIRGPLCLT
jgi:hypothetical protein